MLLAKSDSLLSRQLEYFENRSSHYLDHMFPSRRLGWHNIVVHEIQYLHVCQSDVTDLVLQLFQLLLESGMLLGHFLILLFPLITLLLESLYLALEMAGLDVRLSEPITDVISFNYSLGAVWYCYSARKEGREGIDLVRTSRWLL